MRSTLMGAIADNRTRFTVAIDGFPGKATYDKVMNMAQRGASATARNTEWEMGQILSAGRLKDVNFVSAGVRVENPF